MNRLPRLDAPDAPPRADVGRVCFADEVAIDFPSPRAAIDRMRHAFLGDVPDPPVQLDIWLSPFEAHRGHDVRVEVPLRRTCAVCGGRGEVWGDRCGTCDGVGHNSMRHTLHVAVPPGVRDGSCVNLTVAPHSARGGSAGAATRVELRVNIR
jgi:hypothetical protein